jgi:hypothetical protein
MKKAFAKPVLVRLSVPLLKKLDASAQAQRRSRTAEMNIRLAETFKKRTEVIDTTEVSSPQRPGATDKPRRGQS